MTVCENFSINNYVHYVASVNNVVFFVNMFVYISSSTLYC